MIKSIGPVFYEKDARFNRMMSIGFAAMAGLGITIAAEGNPVGLLAITAGSGLAYLSAKQAEDSAVEAAQAHALISSSE